MDRPLITRVVLENYKSIGFCDVKLRPLAILVGPNGAGKSNFLDALRFLSEAIQGTIITAVRNRGGFNSIIKRGETNHLGIRIEFVTASGSQGCYSIRLERDDRGDFLIERERCAVTGPDAAFYDAMRGSLQSSLATPEGLVREGLYFPVMSGYAPFKPVYDLLSQFRFYNPNPREFLQPANDEDSNRSLGSGGNNLANALNRMKTVDMLGRLRVGDQSRKNFSRLERVTEYIRVINPEIVRITTEAFGGFRYIQFHLKTDREASFSPSQMSDGTLRSLAVLTALFQGAGGLLEVSLVGLEEPEIALHPAAAGVLFDAMQEASASVQVIATTHSADLLDKKDIDTNSILAVELEEGSTRIGPVDQTGRQALRDRLYTAGELMRMNYLRPEALHPNGTEIESILFDHLAPA